MKISAVETIYEKHQEDLFIGNAKLKAFIHDYEGNPDLDFKDGAFIATLYFETERSAVSVKRIECETHDEAQELLNHWASIYRAN